MKTRKAKRAVVSILLSLCMVLALLPAAALADSTEHRSGKWYYYINSDNTASISSYAASSSHAHNFTDTALDIPSVVDDHTVTTIADFALFQAPNLQSVTIPDTVTKIGKGSFQNCSALEHVTFGSGLTVIGELAFNNCPKLDNVVLPDSLVTIEMRAFSFCLSLQHLDLGKGVKTIGQLAFLNTSFRELTLPESLESAAAHSLESGAVEKLTVLSMTTVLDDRAIASESPGPTIVCRAGSLAEKWAKEHRLNCQTLEKTSLNGYVVFTAAVCWNEPVHIALIYEVGDIEKANPESLHFQWQESVESDWVDIPGASTRAYTPPIEMVFERIRLKVTADGRSGEIYSDSKMVGAQANTAFAARPHLLQITPSIIKIENYDPEQEYILSSAPIANLDGSDWSSGLYSRFTSDTFTLETSGGTWYVYTRFAKKQGYYAGDDVEMAAIKLQTNPGLDNVVLEGYGPTGSGKNTIYLKTGETKTINFIKDPVNAGHWSDFTFEPTLSTTLFAVTSPTSGTVASGSAVSSITLQAGSTTGTETLGAYYNGVAYNYGTWRVVVYNPDELPANAVTFTKSNPDSVDCLAGTGFSFTNPTLYPTAEADQFRLEWRVGVWYDGTTPGYSYSGEVYENEYVKITDKAAGTFTALKVSDGAAHPPRLGLVVINKKTNDWSLLSSHGVNVYVPKTVTVQGGTCNYPDDEVPAGALVTVTAGENSYKHPFDHWTLAPEGAAVLSDPNAPVATFLMPSSSDVVVTAHYQDLTPVTSVAANVTAPAKNAVPQDAAAVGAGYTVTKTEWSPAVSGSFQTGTAYTVTVTAKAAEGYVFDYPAMTINGQAADSVSLSTEEAVFSYTFYTFTWGDMNSDKVINTTDALLALRIAVKKIPASDTQAKAGDVNGDGSINTTDALLILRKAINPAVLFPVEIG